MSVWGTMNHEKSLLCHVCDHRICSTHCMIMLVTFSDRYELAQACKNIFWVLITLRNFFRVSQRLTYMSLKLSFFGSQVQRSLWGSMNHKKSLPSHVCDHRICSTHRMITLVTSADRCELKQASKNLFWVLFTLRKCFRVPQRLTYTYITQTLLFWLTSPKKPLREHESQKITAKSRLQP